ncbi:MAG TPA: type II secretion system protein GspG, partial [Gammaproteobacteria bacterium]
PTAKAGTGKPPVAMIILAAVIAVPVIGYVLFSTTNDTATATTSTDAADAVPAAKPGAKSQIERIATVNPAVASKLQNSQVQSKLSALRTTLNMYSIDNDKPPSNEEGLQTLVTKGVATAADITDEWGNDFEYRVEPVQDATTGKDYTIKLYSKGLDGISGTPDDIGLP